MAREQVQPEQVVEQNDLVAVAIDAGGFGGEPGEGGRAGGGIGEGGPGNGEPLRRERHRQDESGQDGERGNAHLD